MHKVVYNNCFGGFSLSAHAVRLAKRAAGKNSAWSKISDGYGCIGDDIERHDPVLVAVVERLGKDANGRFADLKIAEIESNVYRIDEYDGAESVETPSSIEWTVIK